MAIESDTLLQVEAKYMLLSAYENDEKLDSALLLSQELIDYARSHKWGDKQFMIELEQAQILGEMGRTGESNEVVEGIFKKSSPDNGAADYLHMQLAMNALNSGNLSLATKELAIADSFAVEFRIDDEQYRLKDVERVMPAQSCTCPMEDEPQHGPLVCVDIGMIRNCHQVFATCFHNRP